MVRTFRGQTHPPQRDTRTSRYKRRRIAVQHRVVVCSTVVIFAAGVLAASARVPAEACETAGHVMDTPTWPLLALLALPYLSAARPRPRLRCLLPPLSPLAKPLIRIASLTKEFFILSYSHTPALEV